MTLLGALVAVWHVRCGWPDCSGGLPLGIHRNSREAAEVAYTMNWNLHATYRWVCPDHRVEQYDENIYPGEM